MPLFGLVARFGENVILTGVLVGVCVWPFCGGSLRVKGGILGKIKCG